MPLFKIGDMVVLPPDDKEDFWSPVQVMHIINPDSEQATLSCQDKYGDWIYVSPDDVFHYSPVFTKNEHSEIVNTSSYDIVDKPKHYMLFVEHGIEVRDLISLLVKKIELSNYDVMNMLHSSIPEYDGMFISDYVQMMQYYLRFMEKNHNEDIKKGLFYAKKLVQNLEDKE